MNFSIFIYILFSILLSSDKQLYSTVQMLDQIQIINPENLQIGQSVETEFHGDINCIDYDSQMDCTMNVNCIWVDNHCMDSKCNWINQTSLSHRDTVKCKQTYR